MKKVLILSTSTGYGHNQAANSLMELIKNDDTEILVHDFLKENRFFDRSIVNGYDLCASSLGTLYGLLYKISNIKFINNLVSFLFLPVANKLAKFIHSFNPDLIITTHPLAVSILSYLKKRQIIKVPVISVVTDFKCHYTYVSKIIDHYIVACDFTKENLASKGIPKERISPFGIPVKQDFYKEDYHNYVENIIQSPLNILLMGGGMGLDNISKVLKTLIKNDNPLNLTIVCGNNAELKKELCKEYGHIKGNKKLNILGYTTEIPKIMKSSDLIITKPGGLTTTESLLSHLPMIIPFIIPGQESENREFLSKSNCAITINHLEELNKVINDLNKDNNKLINMRKSILDVLSSYSPEGTIKLCTKMLNDSYNKRRY
ncbi:MGDG synthase family glycosyltransferase [Clostridium perfringens]|uniref:MGDG synthase family glycosyltransferase n=1 Tax=Clostridium perfringens TaxID=1502 RepID=UPI002FF340CB